MSEQIQNPSRIPDATTSFANTEAVQGKIESQIGSLESLYALIEQCSKDISELKGKRPKAPGEGASKEAKAEYETAKTSFFNKLDRLNGQLLGLQDRLKTAETVLNGLKGDLPVAQQRDATEIERAITQKREQLQKSTRGAGTTGDGTVSDGEIEKIELRVVEQDRHIDIKLHNGSTVKEAFKALFIMANVIKLDQHLGRESSALIGGDKRSGVGIPGAGSGEPA